MNFFNFPPATALEPIQCLIALVYQYYHAHLCKGTKIIGKYTNQKSKILRTYNNNSLAHISYRFIFPVLKRIIFFEISKINVYLHLFYLDIFREFANQPTISKYCIRQYLCFNFIVLLHFRAANMYEEIYAKLFRPVVSNDGLIFWAFGGVIEARCRLDLTYFPFDRQKCSLIIENWAYQSNSVDLYSANAHVLTGYIHVHKHTHTPHRSIPTHTYTHIHTTHPQLHTHM